MFFFCTAAEAALLPTIRSRCVEMPLREDSDETPGEDALALCRAVGSGKRQELIRYLVSLENRRIKREELQSLLQDAWAVSAEALLQRAGKPESAAYRDGIAALASLNDRRLQFLTGLFARYAEDCQYNVGPGHVLGALLSELSDQEVTK